jgi:hypothetical protein
MNSTALLVLVAIALTLLGRPAFSENTVLPEPPRQVPVQPLPPLNDYPGYPGRPDQPYPYPSLSQVVLTGKILSMDSRSITLVNVVGPIPGRMSGVQVRVDMCAGYGCIKPDFEPRIGDYVKLAAEQRGDFFFGPVHKIVRLDAPVTSPIARIQGEVRQILPSAGGWQSLLVFDGVQLVELQTCAPYMAGPPCPLVRGDFRKLGTRIRAAAVPMAPGKFWKTEIIEAMQVEPPKLPNLSVAPLIDFSEVEIGKKAVLNIEIKNSGDGAALNVVPAFTNLPPGFYVNPQGCPRVEARGNCLIEAAFSPIALGEQSAPVTFVFQNDIPGVSSGSVIHTKLRGVGTKPPPPAPAKFFIGQGLINRDWNTPTNPLVLTQGQELTFVNQTITYHRLYMNGFPCSVGTMYIPGGASVSCKVSAPSTKGFPRVIRHAYGGALFIVIK